MISFVDDFINGLVVAGIAAIGWIVRNVFTNSRQIAILHEGLRKVDEKHTETKTSMKEDIREIKTDVKDMSTIVTAFIAAQSEVNKQRED